MELRIKNLNISAGALISIINEDDAKKLDLKPSDRIKIKKGRKEIITAVDIASSKNHTTVKVGEIGLFQEVIDELNGKEKEKVEIKLDLKPESIQYIKNKLDGKHLSKHEMDEIITDIITNRLTENEMTYFISGCYINGLSLYESTYLTEAIVNSGKQLKLNKYPILDKHCVSGLPGNRTTMIIVPIIAAAGYTIAKTSTRSITSASVSYDTPILIKENKINKIVKIGSFIDNLCKNKKCIKKEENSEYLGIKNNKYKVPIFDKNFKISYKPLTGIFRHKSPDLLNHIILKGGEMFM